MGFRLIHQNGLNELLTNGSDYINCSGVFMLLFGRVVIQVAASQESMWKSSSIITGKAASYAI